MIAGVKKFVPVKYYIPRGKGLFRDNRGRKRVNTSPNKRLILENKKNIDYIDLLADQFNLDLSLRDEFRESVNCVAFNLKSKVAQAELPDRPERDYQPREDLFAYLRSEEGFGPWIAAGALTRPEIRKAPKAYAALTYWIKSGRPIPSDLHIPTKSDLVDRRIAAAGGSEQAIRSLARTVESRQRRSPRTPEL